MFDKFVLKLFKLEKTLKAKKTFYCLAYSADDGQLNLFCFNVQLQLRDYSDFKSAEVKQINGSTVLCHYDCTSVLLLVQHTCLLTNNSTR